MATHCNILTWRISWTEESAVHGMQSMGSQRVGHDGESNNYQLQYSSLENPHGQKSLVGYSPWGFKESGLTERLSFGLSN